jgi:hypothetical protein
VSIREICGRTSIFPQNARNARIFTKTASGGAAVSAAPINKMVLLTRMVHLYYDGALLALASGKAERRQVHPLKDGSVGMARMPYPPKKQTKVLE